MAHTYCGNKAVPAGKTRGTPLGCLRKGIGVGMGIEQRKQARIKQQQKRTEGRQRTANLIDSRIKEQKITKVQALVRGRQARRKLGIGLTKAQINKLPLDKGPNHLLGILRARRSAGLIKFKGSPKSRGRDVKQVRRMLIANLKL